MSSTRIAGTAWVLWALLAGTVRPGHTQQPPPVRADTVVVDTLYGVSPRGAMIRSMLVPGWGQASAGSNRRGAVFFALQTTSWYMLFRTMGRLSEARDIEGRRVASASDSLRLLMEEDTAAARRLADPFLFEEAISENAAVAEMRALANSRRRHRQDWVTYTLFFTMASAVDAYVTAHLRDFPVELSAEPLRNGSVAVGLSVPVGARR